MSIVFFMLTRKGVNDKLLNPILKADILKKYHGAHVNATHFCGVFPFTYIHV